MELFEKGLVTELKKGMEVKLIPFPKYWEGCPSCDLDMKKYFDRIVTISKAVPLTDYPDSPCPKEYWFHIYEDNSEWIYTSDWIEKIYPR